MVVTYLPRSINNSKHNDDEEEELQGGWWWERLCAQKNPLFVLASKTVKKVDIVKTEFNQEFIKGILTKIDYDALRNAVSQTKRKFWNDLNHTRFNIFLTSTTETIKLPEKITDEMIENVEFLKVLHHVLLEIVVVEGQLICPESGRIFPISQGIPNMLLNEDEV